MKLQVRTSKISGALGLMGMAALLGAASVEAEVGYGGRGVGAWIQSASGTQSFADTGDLSPLGTEVVKEVQSALVQLLLMTGAQRASASGANGVSSSDAVVQNAHILYAFSPSIGVTSMTAAAEASCSGGGVGSSHVEGVTVGDTTVEVTGEPNQVIDLDPLLGASGTMTLNEQITSSENGTQSVTVNAVHIVIPTDPFMDLMLGSATASVSNCNVLPPNCQDFIAGGGYVTTEHNGHGVFGLLAGYRRNQPEPVIFLHYVDERNHVRLDATSLEEYGPGATSRSRLFTGAAKVNGQAGFTYVVEVADPVGRDTHDTFRIEVSNGYSASGNVRGGVVELFKGCRRRRHH